MNKTKYLYPNRDILGEGPIHRCGPIQVELKILKSLREKAKLCFYSKTCNTRFINFPKIRECFIIH